MTKIAFLGDVCPGGVLPYQNKYIDESVLSYLNEFDLRICTLECAIGTGFKYEPTKLSENGGNNNINFIRDEDAFRLSELGINIVTMANNHAIDLGYDGFKNTIKQLQKYNIQYIGAGMNLEEASKPLILKLDDNKSLAIIACCIEGTYPWACTVATNDIPGIYKTNIRELVSKIKLLKKTNDIVIVMPHWGEEHRFLPPLECKKYATMIANAGADAIFASHSHTYGPIVKIKDCNVAYAMGNFLFPDFCMIPPRPMYYPVSKSELSHFIRVKNYPKIIQNETISVWDKDSRIGLILEYTVNENKIHYQFINLLDNNILKLLKDVNPIKEFLLKHFKMPIGKMIMKSKYLIKIFRKLTTLI